MITIDQLLYKIDQRLNKLSSNAHQEVQLEDKILALNEAQIKLIKTKYTGISVMSRIGFDGMKKRYQDIENLIVDFKKNSLTLKELDSHLNQWEAPLSELNPKYMLYGDAYVLADKGRCKDRIIWVNNDLAKHADVSLLLTNSDFKPSFEYQETFNTITDNKMSIYTDGTFSPKTLHISYIRYPQEMDKEGYVKFDGSNSKDVNCELVDYLEDELLDLAVANIADYTENVAAAQTARNRSMTNE